MDGESAKCVFCGETKMVSRYYMRIANKHFDNNKKGAYSTYVAYCADCGIIPEGLDINMFLVNNPHIVKDLARVHSTIRKNCTQHPNGQRRCKDCTKSKWSRVSLGEAMRLVKNMSIYAKSKIM